MDCLVSVVIPCFNGERFVAEAIASAFAQSHPCIEVIVVDDGSTDGSAREIGRFPAVKLHRQPNGGVSAARNAGLAKASGSYVVFLDADDRLMPDAVLHHLHAFAAHHDSVLVYGAVDQIDDRGHVLRRCPLTPAVFGYWDVLREVMPNPSQCMVKRSAIDQAGPFDVALSAGEDWDFYLRLSRVGEVARHDKHVADYRRHGAQATRRPAAIMRGFLAVVAKHRALFAQSPGDHLRFDAARRRSQRWIGRWMPTEVARRVGRGEWRQAGVNLLVFGQNLPHSVYGFSLAHLSDRLKRRFERARWRKP